jgi:hypothetical protein
MLSENEMNQQQKALLVGAWQAELGPRVTGPNSRISYAATAYGSYKLSIGSSEYLLDMVAAGLFTDVMKGDTRVDMEWIGPSEFTDSDGDLLRAEGISKDGSLFFQLGGGTGKWAKAQGKIFVDDIFTFNDGKRLRAFESGKGEVSA